MEFRRLDLQSSVVVKPSQALALHKREIRKLVEQSRARNPRDFGSVLHGRDTETSDLDASGEAGPRLADFLDHIEEASRLAREPVAGMSKESFLKDRRTRHAVVPNR